MIVSENEMTKDTLSDRHTITLVAFGLALGIAAERLLWNSGPIGIGFVIWLFLLGLSASWLVYYIKADWLLQVLTWSAVVVTSAILTLFRVTPLVVLLLWFVVIVAAGMVLLQRSGISFRESTVVQQIVAGLRVPLQALLATFPVLARLDLESNITSPRIWSITRGLLIVLPLLVIFFLLFASADAAFDRFAQRFADYVSVEMFQHILMILVFTWLSIGLLSDVCENRISTTIPDRSFLKLGTEDTAVIMGLLAVMFLAFVFFQLNYLFGGRETIEAVSGLTLSEYARRGFFELLVVAGLTLAVLIAIAASGCNLRVFKPLALVLIACVMVMLVSAMQRLLLYIEEFGLTIDRLTAVAGMLWLAIALIWFSTTILRGRTRDFAAGLVVSGIVIVFLYALSNPAAQVARTNINRATSDDLSLDTAYLIFLGADAVPLLVDRINELPVEAGCSAAKLLLGEWLSEARQPGDAQSDWRSWTVSQATAQRAVEQNRSRLVDLAGNCDS